MLSFEEFVTLNKIKVNSFDEIMDAKEEYDDFEFSSWCTEIALKYNSVYDSKLQLPVDFYEPYAARKVYFDKDESNDHELHLYYSLEGWKWVEILCNCYDVNDKYEFPADEPIGFIDEDPWTAYFVNETTGESNMPGTCHGWNEEELEYEHWCEEEDLEYELWCEEKAEYYNKIEGLIEWGNKAFAEEFYDEISWVYKVIDEYDKIENMKAWAKTINTDDYDYSDNKNCEDDEHVVDLLNAYDIIRASIDDNSIHNIDKAEIILNALSEFSSFDLKYSKDRYCDYVILDDCRLCVSDWSSGKEVVYYYSLRWRKGWATGDDSWFVFNTPSDEAYKKIIDAIIEAIGIFN